MIVVVKKNETLEQALERFKKKVSKSGLLNEIKSRQYYEKPSQKKNRRKRSYRQDKSKKK